MIDQIAAIAVIAGLLLLAAVFASAFKTFRISPWEQGALFVDGGYERMLPAGRHRVLAFGRKLDVRRVSSATAYLTIGPVEAVTADGMPIRMNATIGYRIVDIERSLQAAIDPMIRVAASQALLKLAAGQRLEDLMRPTAPSGNPLLALIELPEPTVQITSAGLAALVLPPELRRMLTEVERARLEGLAALERARGEQAALRSLANAARLLKDNPDLLNLRLLQAVGAGKGATLVLGEGALKVGSNAS